MKRSKAKAAPAAQETRMPSAAQEDWRPRDTAQVVLFSILLFAAMTVQTGRMTLVLTALALVLSIGKKPMGTLGSRLCVPVIGFLAYLLMNGLAALYSPFGGDAMSEFYKIMASASLAVILLARFEKKHAHGLLWGFGAVCAVIGFLCVDLGGAKILFTPFSQVTQLLGADYSDVEAGTTAARLNGIYNDANLTGALLGMSILVLFYLTVREKRRDRRGIACLLLGISLVGFVTAMSRGAIVFFCLAALFYLAVAEKGRRMELFLLMVEAAAASVLAAFWAMGHIGTGSLVPDAACFMAGGLIFLLDWGIGTRLAALLRDKGKILLAAGGVLAVGCVAFGVAALNLTEPYVLEEGGRLYRSLSLEAGDYTLSGDWDGGEATTALIYSQTREEALMGKLTTLYRGPLATAAFTLPEEAGQVFFQIRGSAGDTLRQITLSDGTELPMAYRFLPETVAERLQDGLFRGHSFLQRTQYIKDAWTLFLRSPLIGHGLSSTEGLYTTVQPYFYQSLFVHNHLLQAMCDMGLLGLASLLALLLGSAWLLLRPLFREKDPLAAVLLAVWVMMNGHSLMEINFSIRMFQCAAFFLLLLPVLCYAKPIPEEKFKAGKRVAVCGLWVFLALFGGLLESSRMVAREAAEYAPASVEEFMDTLRSYIRRDVFDPEQHQLNFVGNAVLLGDSQYQADMVKYAEQLRRSGTYTACSGLAQYYYLPLGEWEELFACSREGIAQEAATRESWNLQLDFYRTEVLAAMTEETIDAYLEGVMGTLEYLDTFNQGRMEEIVLSAENQAFAGLVRSIQGQGIQGAEALNILILTEIG